MKTNYLFPNKYKKIGWCIFIPSIIIGSMLLLEIIKYSPDFLSINVLSLISDKGIAKIINNNIFKEIVAILAIISSLLVAFSKEKTEDEYISKIRLESLVWAVYVNYGILLIAFLFIYDTPFLTLMQLNMFTVLLFFIIRFNWVIFKLKNSANNEE